MDIKKAKIVKQINDKWGFCIFTEDYKGNPEDPVLYLLEKCDKKDKWQLCGGWYCEDLLDSSSEGRGGIAIDFGSNWICDGDNYHKIWIAMKAWMELYKLSDFDTTQEVF